MPVIHLRVVGKVQGVGFRWFVCDRAASLGLAGWVRNTSDGDVEVAASGDASELEAITRMVGRGPSAARVDAVHQISPPPGTRYPTPFQIAP